MDSVRLFECRQRRHQKRLKNICKRIQKITQSTEKPYSQNHATANSRLCCLPRILNSLLQIAKNALIADADAPPVQEQGEEGRKPMIATTSTASLPDHLIPRRRAPAPSLQTTDERGPSSTFFSSGPSKQTRSRTRDHPSGRSSSPASAQETRLRAEETVDQKMQIQHQGPRLQTSPDETVDLVHRLIRGSLITTMQR